MSTFMIFGNHRGDFVLYGSYDSLTQAKEDLDLAYTLNVSDNRKLEWSTIENPFTKNGVVLTTFDGTVTTQFFIIEVSEPRENHSELDWRIQKAFNGENTACDGETCLC